MIYTSVGITCAIDDVKDQRNILSLRLSNHPRFFLHGVLKMNLILNYCCEICESKPEFLLCFFSNYYEV